MPITPNNLPSDLMDRIRELGATINVFAEDNRFIIEPPKDLDSMAENELLNIAAQLGTQIEIMRGIGANPTPLDKERILAIQGYFQTQ